MRLIEIDWPDFGGPASPPAFTVSDYLSRIDAARAAMKPCGLTHLVIYADREHFANMAWLTGFDPRFEEALLILRDEATAPLIATGIECERYLAISPIRLQLRHERFDGFSLPGIAPQTSRGLAEILASEGIGADSNVGCVGWKTYGHPGQSDLPSYIVDLIRPARVTNATDIFIHLATGLRATVTATEIAWLEYANFQASEAMKRMIFSLRPGMTDRECVQAAAFNGDPQGCHWGVKTGAHRISLASPIGALVAAGQPWSGNICYRGANCCRAGWLARSAAQAPAGFLDDFAMPYIEAMAAWLAGLRIGRPCGELTAGFPRDRFGLTMTPGHLTHLEEWLGTPFESGSTVPLRSGMAIQSDVIPSSRVYGSIRFEDTWVLADASLQSQLTPDCLRRCVARREFLRGVLGFTIPDELLPLSNIAGLAPPYLLAPRQIIAA